MPETLPMCTQCKVNPRADNRPDASNPWCKDCRARYQREYTALRMDRKERLGFVRGRDEMRKMVAREFMKLSGGMFSGAEIARLVTDMPGPQVFDD